MSPCDFAEMVPHRLNLDVVDVHCAKHIFPNQFLVLMFKVFIAPARCHELVFARLTAIDFVVAIEEGTVADKKRHLETLVHKSKVLFVGQSGDPHVGGVLGHHVFEVLEELNKFLRQNAIYSYLQDAEGRRVVPSLVHVEICVWVLMHDRDLVSLMQEPLSHFKQLLLNLHPAFLSIYGQIIHHLFI